MSEMDLLTIYNYEGLGNNFNLLKLWLKQAKIHNDENLPVHVLSYMKEPEHIKELHDQYDFTWKVLPMRNVIGHAFLDKHNIRFKLFNLTKWESPYLFIDVDAFLFSNISGITRYKGTKKWVGIDHQNIPLHTENKGKFLNSGVQLVSDPDFLNYEKVVSTVRQIMCPGFDQAMLFSYFKTIGYDYTHPEINENWNACAGYTRTYQEDGVWKCITDPVNIKNDRLVSKGIKKGETVHINHYWDEFKPWMINCEFYKQMLTK